MLRLHTFVILALAGTLSACYKGREQGPIVAFDLPAGWEFLVQEPRYTAVTTHKASKDGLAPRVKLETSPDSTFPGTEQDAKAYIDDLHALELQEVHPPGWPDSEIMTMALPSGVTVHADIRPEIFWARSDAIPWGSIIAFSVENQVIVMYLEDRADQYVSELDIITRSTKVIAD